MLKDHSMKA